MLESNVPAATPKSAAEMQGILKANGINTVQINANPEGIVLSGTLRTYGDLVDIINLVQDHGGGAQIMNAIVMR